jgi:OmpA-OmpF porin, OOP family
VRRAALGGLAAALIAALGACVADRMRGEIGSVLGTIQAARASGAEICAPAQLARAVAHIEFAALELDEGDYYRARSELAVAGKSAADALRLSPRARCAAAASTADLDGDGVPDERDECGSQPEDRDGVQDDDGCPDPDNDGDGLPDTADRCADDPEDLDGFEDRDGCPDRDNDRDGMADRIDQCPDQAEDPDGHDDDDGCPDCDDDGDGVPECPQAVDRCPGRAGRPPDGCPFRGVVLTERRIQTGQPIRFAGRRQLVITPASRAVLDEVARVLAAHPRLRVRVDAHTDSKGPAGRNLRVSRARAAAVKRYLVARGIDANRVSTAGYGEVRPIAQNRTPVGRAHNNRVEFVITGR